MDDMVGYIGQLARGDETSTPKEIPRPVIITRIKGYYRAQRQQKKTARLPLDEGEDAFRTGKTA